MTDDRSYLLHGVNAMSVEHSQVFFYPRLLPLHELQVNGGDLDDAPGPVAIRCSYERLKDTGVYLLENGLVMYMWLGMAVNPEWVQNVFGVQSAAQIDIDQSRVQELDNPLSRKVRSIIQSVQQTRNRHMKLVIIRQRDKLEPIFRQYLMEDHSASGSVSYVEYLCHIHKEIRNLLS